MPNPVALSIQVLGPFVVTRDGMPVPAHELASRKGRTLLKLLLARRGGVVPAEALVEALWGDRPPADPDANLATLVSRLRAVLGPDAIAGGRAGWRFVAGPRLTVDLDDAERLVAEAEGRLAGEPALALAARELGDLGRARELAERAVELTGPAATSHPALHAQLALAECLLQAGGRAEAAALLELAGGRLQRPFAYRWRVELRHAELASRLEPAAAERLLDLAGTYGSAKYRRSPSPGSAAIGRRCRSPPRSGPTICSPRSPAARSPAPPSTAWPPPCRPNSAPPSWTAAASPPPSPAADPRSPGRRGGRQQHRGDPHPPGTPPAPATAAAAVQPCRPRPRTRRGRQGSVSGGRAATAAIASRRTAAGSSTSPATPTVASR
jgi:hypothetical protein